MKLCADLRTIIWSLDPYGFRQHARLINLSFTCGILIFPKRDRDRKVCVLDLFGVHTLGQMENISPALIYWC